MRMMAPGLAPQAPQAPRSPQRSPQRSPLHAPAQGLGAVRRQRDFERWMADAPLGIPHLLGLASVVAVGLAFFVLALNGTFHGVLFVCAGLGTAAFGVWRLVSFFRAPILNRVACVVDERERIQRTRHGWRTRCYATFEFEDGTREEFPVSSGLAAALVRGDCGVLVTRDIFLLAFHGAGR
jgi:hypothetical protein